MFVTSPEHNYCENFWFIRIKIFYDFFDLIVYIILEVRHILCIPQPIRKPLYLKYICIGFFSFIRFINLISSYGLRGC